MHNKILVFNNKNFKNLRISDAEYKKFKIPFNTF